jgi:hypothetical protein
VTHQDPFGTNGHAQDNLLPKAIPLNYQMDDFRGISGNKSGLLAVCFGQRAHAPADGNRVSSCVSNGAFMRSKWTSRSIHARSSRTLTASAFLSFRIAAAFRYCGKHSYRARRWSFGCYVVAYITTASSAAPPVLPGGGDKLTES